MTIYEIDKMTLDMTAISEIFEVSFSIYMRLKVHSFEGIPIVRFSAYMRLEVNNLE